LQVDIAEHKKMLNMTSKWVWKSDFSWTQQKLCELLVSVVLLLGLHEKIQGYFCIIRLKLKRPHSAI